MSVLRVPYHLDEYLPHLDLPLEQGRDITPALPAGDVWDRLGVLYSAVGQAVADITRSGARPVVVSGDCTTSLGIMAGLQHAGRIRPSSGSMPTATCRPWRPPRPATSVACRCGC